MNIMDTNSTPQFLSFKPRDRDEAHRAATMLELMFDLAAVIAIAAAAAGLHHALAGAHIAEGIIGFMMSFFMIWLAWMNYTWLASAYDDGSLLFRVVTMIIMFGALMLAAGIPAVFDQQPLYLVLAGFVTMRLGLVVLWLAAARGDPDNRKIALRYAGGISIMQVYWVSIILSLPADSSLTMAAFILGFACELVIPAIAERNGRTNWHRHHIIERYGLLNIIVLGECFLAIVMALKTDAVGLLPSWPLLGLGITASVITFTLWSLYFSREEHLRSEELSHTLLWGYGHFALFASGAAVGAGFAVMVEITTHHADVDLRIGALAVAIPTAVYVSTLWIIRDRFWMSGIAHGLLPMSAALIVIAGAVAPNPMLMIMVIMLVTAFFRSRIAQSL